MEKLNILRAAPVGIEDTDDDVAAALEIASELTHPVYDCLYLALALREEIRVITADRRFFSAASRVRRFSPSVVMLDDYAGFTGASI